MIFITLLNIAIFQGIILGVIILKSPIFKSKANKYLAYAIFSLSILLLNLVFELTQIYNTIPFLYFFDTIGLELAFPVFILLFITHQVNHPILQSKRILWLFTPFLFTAVINIFSNLDTIAHVYKIPNFIQQIIEVLKLIQIIVSLLFLPSILIYAYTCIKVSNNVQEKKWITHLWLLIFILLTSFVLTIIVALFLDIDITPIMRTLALLATFLIHWIVYTGIFKFKLAKDQEEIKTLLKINTNLPVAEITIPKVSSEKKIETFTQENSYFKKLEDLCKNHHIYRDSTLDRDKVADMLGISTGYVSQLVNTITGNNFATYINHYRVKAVKDIILNSEFDNYSLLAIGLECGFSSKSTFHNAFKKITGITPNAYRKQH
ncbi:helix-turn-helix domain-containing protein [Aquimarina longa]|uniref:helix-turn-helix domain-containing protein n=1 Tax=Aquimarina longa TaxID=1080221 RepID=UPI000781B064|nr:helix-turn-helix domain-containing protein [Aquimarina longa]